MPRVPRSVLPDGLFHVATRGVAKMAIYLDDNDRRNFLGLLALAVQAFEWDCLAFCLMTTHYHLVLETSRQNLSDGIADAERRLRTGVQREVRALGARVRRPLLVAAAGRRRRARADLRVRDGEPGARRSLQRQLGLALERVPSRARLGHRLREHEREEHDADQTVDREER